LHWDYSSHGCLKQITFLFQHTLLDDPTTSRENGSGGGSDITDDALDGPTTSGSDEVRRRAAMGHIQEKIDRTMEQIRDEQSTKEG